MKQSNVWQRCSSLLLLLGIVVLAGNASARCGISMKGVDIVVGGNVGHMSAFMAQAGNLVVCGDAGEGLHRHAAPAACAGRPTPRSMNSMI